MKNIKKSLFIIPLLAILITPAFASTITVEELQAKIADLQRQIQELQAQLSQYLASRTLSTPPSPSTTGTTSGTKYVGPTGTTVTCVTGTILNRIITQTGTWIVDVNCQYRKISDQILTKEKAQCQAVEMGINIGFTPTGCPTSSGTKFISPSLPPCTVCLAGTGFGSCAEACQKLNYGTSGYCAFPESTRFDQCCGCTTSTSGTSGGTTTTYSYKCSTTDYIYSSFASCQVGCGPSGGTCNITTPPPTSSGTKFIGPIGGATFPQCTTKQISSTQSLPSGCGVCAIGQKYIKVYDENGRFRAYCPDSSGNVTGMTGPGASCGYGGCI